jgi:hypothetical protein
MLHRKGQGKEAKLAYLGYGLLDHLHGLVANVCATHATGTAERDAAYMIGPVVEPRGHIPVIAGRQGSRPLVADGHTGPSTNAIGRYSHDTCRTSCPPEFSRTLLVQPTTPAL